MKCITHLKTAEYLYLRESYVILCGGNHCAAALLSVFERLTNSQLNLWEAVGRKEGLIWIQARVEKLVSMMFGLYTDKSVREALKFLLSRQLVTQSSTPPGQLKSYLLNSKWVEYCATRLLDATTVDSEVMGLGTPVILPDPHKPPPNMEPTPLEHPTSDIEIESTGGMIPPVILPQNYRKITGVPEPVSLYSLSEIEIEIEKPLSLSLSHHGKEDSLSTEHSDLTEDSPSEEQPEPSVAAPHPTSDIQTNESEIDPEIPTPPKPRSRWPKRFKKDKPARDGPSASDRLRQMRGNNLAKSFEDISKPAPLGNAPPLHVNLHAPEIPGIDWRFLLTRWNELVLSFPVQWDDQRDAGKAVRLAKLCQDSDFVARFDELCRKAEAINRAGKAWVHFKWLIGTDKATGDANWWRLASGEFDGMTQPDKKWKKPDGQTACEELLKELDEEIKQKNAANA